MAMTTIISIMEKPCSRGLDGVEPCIFSRVCFTFALESPSNGGRTLLFGG
jgi:hypothetical protein